MIDAFRDPRLDTAPALDLALGLTNGADTGTDYYNAGAIIFAPATPVTGDPSTSRSSSTAWTEIGARNGPQCGRLARATQCTGRQAGPIRDFDYNLDGLSHYGMLPDMLQDLKKRGAPARGPKTRFFGSAERLHRGLGAERSGCREQIPHPTVSCP